MSNERETNFFRTSVDPKRHPNFKTGPELQEAETERQRRTQARHREDFNSLTEGFAPPVEDPKDPTEK